MGSSGRESLSTSSGRASRSCSKRRAELFPLGRRVGSIVLDEVAGGIEDEPACASDRDAAVRKLRDGVVAGGEELAGHEVAVEDADPLVRQRGAGQRVRDRPLEARDPELADRVAVLVIERGDVARDSEDTEQRDAAWAGKCRS